MEASITKSRPRHVAAASDVDSAITRNTHREHNATEGEGEAQVLSFFLSLLCAQPSREIGPRVGWAVRLSKSCFV